MTRKLDIACLQTRPQPDFDAATDEALTLARRAAEGGAKMLFLPEYCGGLKSSGASLVPPFAPEGAHPVIAALRDFAASSGVWVNIGSVAVEGPAGRILNRGLMIDDTGVVRGRYDKLHMFDIQISDDEVYRESDTVAPGDEAVLHDTPFGVIGHTICYDLRFPHLYRDLAQAGAEILATPAAFVKKTGEAHWHVLNRARAIENGAFVVSACASGPIPGGGECYGHSVIVDPWGAVLADGGEGAGVVAATIDLAMVAATRARIPSLAHDRPYRLGATMRKDVA